MPTARELLEEADALMRRNRTHERDDIPLLTDSVPGGAQAQVLRGRGAQVRTGAQAPSPLPVAEEGDSIPTLTERVVEEPVPPASPAAHAPPAAVAQVAMPDAEGEPSDWLHRELGEASITGEMPDSVLVAPSRHGAAAELPGFDDETEEIEVVAPPAEAEEAFEAEFHETVVKAETVDQVDTVDEVDTVIDRDLIDEDEIARPEGLDETPAPLVAAAVPLAAAPVAPAPVHVAPAAASDDARWDGVAEEIRMQVLQRIDIFTDTGLREQLSLRLQPIVDRASADLVATINQHVGELLRAYVAEAIEREIESWRRSH